MRNGESLIAMKHDGSCLVVKIYLFIYFILFATLITKNIGKEEEEEEKRSGEET